MTTTTTTTYPKRHRMAKPLHARDSAPLAFLPVTQREDAVIAEALTILERRLLRGSALTSPGAVRDYLRVSSNELKVVIPASAGFHSENRLLRTVRFP